LSEIVIEIVATSFTQGATPEIVYEITVVPTETGLTTPEASTVATEGSEEDQVPPGFPLLM
jgi:hypothetical protein